MSDTKALLVIAVQHGLIDGPYPHYEKDTVLANIAGLLNKARESDTPIVYIQHDGSGPDHPLKPGSDAWQIHPLIAPMDGEIVIRKRASDAFYETSLQATLRELGVDHLVVTGCDTDFCVDATTRRALSEGYDVTLVGDAHTTGDWGVIPAAQVIAHHNWALANLAHPDHQVMVQPAGEVRFRA